MNFEAEVLGQTRRLALRARDGLYEVDLDGRRFAVEALFDGPFVTLVIDNRRHEAGLAFRGARTLVALPGHVLEVEVREAAAAGPQRRTPSGPAQVKAPMPGKVVRVLVKPGDAVLAGAGLVVVEAMKMENELRAPRGGVVLDVLAREGQSVESDALLAVVG